MIKIPENAVFPNPLVKQVIFQVRFAPLFYLEAKVGEFQMEVIHRFPQSELVIRRSMVFAQAVDLSAVAQPEGAIKIWRFKNADGVSIELKHDAMTIHLSNHSSYRNGISPFRGVIEFALAGFKKIFKAPEYTRIGLRYINTGSLQAFTTAALKEGYDSSFPADRFPVDQVTEESSFRVVSRRGENLFLIYQENLHPPTSEDEGGKITLDFDVFSLGVGVDEVLTRTDELHRTIRAEFEATLRDPTLRLMQRQPEDAR